MKLKNYWNQINQLLKPRKQNEVVNQSNLLIKIADLESKLRLSNDSNVQLVNQVYKLTNDITKLHKQIEANKDIKTLEAKIQNRDECYAALLDWTMNNIGKEPTFDVNVMKNYWIDQIK
jgi:septal ring factor EnvC (AmiA/AmiB activator)